MTTEQPSKKIDRPLVGHVIVEVDYDEDREEPIHSFVSSPFPTREKAERESDKREEAYRDVFEREDDDYDAKDFSVTEIHIHSLNQLQAMDEERHETMMGAVNAVGASLLAGDDDV